MSQRITSDLLKEPKIPIGFLNDLNRCASREEVFSAYAKWSGRIISADRTTVAIADLDKRNLDLMAIDGNKAIDTGSSIPIDGTMLGRVFLSQTPEICADLASRPEGTSPQLPAAGLTSSMVAPLSAGNRRFGILAQGFAEAPPPTEDDLAILHAIANCLGSHLLLHEQLAQLGELALTDPLTRVFNRRVFEERVGALWTRLRDHGNRFSIALLDLDHFKCVNDTFGHDFGDEVLKAVAATLKSASRANDTVIRMGGEEFCVVLEDTGLDEALWIVERWRDQVSSLQFDRFGETVTVTASFGVATADPSHDSPRLVSMMADNALYRAKQAGRNRVAPAA